MANLRVKCACGHVQNGYAGTICPRCKQPLAIPQEGMIKLYRMGSPLGVAGGFGLYLNGEPYGHIGNKETLYIPLPYGTYQLHVAVGMSRRCNDLIATLTPQNPVACAKVRIKPGFWSNSFVIEPAQESEIPQ